MGPFVADGDALGIVLVVMGGVGLFLGEALDLPGECGRPLQGRGAPGGEDGSPVRVHGRATTAVGGFFPSCAPGKGRRDPFAAAVLFAGGR